MARTCKFPISVSTINRKIDKNIPHYCTIDGKKYILRLSSVKLS